MLSLVSPQEARFWLTQHNEPSVSKKGEPNNNGTSVTDSSARSFLILSMSDGNRFSVREVCLSEVCAGLRFVSGSR